MRWVALIFLNCFGMFLVLLLSGPWAEILAWAVGFALGTPLVTLHFLLTGRAADIGTILLNAPLWATLIEWLLQRFVDRPKDSDAGKGE